MLEFSQQLQQLDIRAKKSLHLLVAQLVITNLFGLVNIFLIIKTGNMLFYVAVAFLMSVVSWVFLNRYFKKSTNIKNAILEIETEILNSNYDGITLKSPDSSPISMLTDPELIIERLDGDFLDYDKYLPITTLDICTLNDIDNEHTKNMPVKFIKNDTFKVETLTVQINNYPDFDVTNIYLPQSTNCYVTKTPTSDH